ncbi:MAG: hypothetical protein ACRC3H_09585 [Lachnospiraceae bacterium]
MIETYAGRRKTRKTRNVTKTSTIYCGLFPRAPTLSGDTIVPELKSADSVHIEVQHS